MHPLMKQLLEEHKALVSLVTEGLDFGQIHSCNTLSFDFKEFILLGFVQLI